MIRARTRARMPAVWLGALAVSAAAVATTSATAATPAIAGGVPEAARVAVVITPAAPSSVLGLDEDVHVTIRITGPGPDVVEVPRLLCNVGAVEKPDRLGPREFTARYVLPATRFPQIAIIAAEVPLAAKRSDFRHGLLGSGAGVTRGYGIVRLRAATGVLFRTEPRASVTLHIGDKEFGPALADGDGRVRLPVVVPPGIQQGAARSVDAAGNTTTKMVDLQTTPTGHLLIVAPAAIEAGASAEVAVFAVEPDGSPTPAAAITLASSAAPPRSLGGSAQEGEARFTVQAPTRLPQPAALRLTAAAVTTSARPDRGPPPRRDTRGDLRVPLRPGRARRLVLTPSAPGHVVVGSSRLARVTFTAEDQYGNHAPITKVDVLIDGAPAWAEPAPDGRMVLDVPAPGTYQGKDSVKVEGSLDGIRGAREIPISGGAPVRIELSLADQKIVGDGRASTEVRMRIVDRFGAPTDDGGGGPDSFVWRATGGAVAGLSRRGIGVYTAQFSPHLAVRNARASIEVEQPRAAAPALRAAASVDVEAPFRRLAVTPRLGFFTNLGRSAGPLGFVEVAGRPPWWHRPLRASLAVGYMRSSFEAGDSAAATRVDLALVPILAGARYHFHATATTEVSLGASLGISFAAARLETSGLTTGSTDIAFAAALSAEATIAAGVGQIVVGARHMWIELGQLSTSNRLRGNAAGLVGDVGYRLGF